MSGFRGKVLMRIETLDEHPLGWGMFGNGKIMLSGGILSCFCVSKARKLHRRELVLPFYLPVEQNT